MHRHTRQLKTKAVVMVISVVIGAVSVTVRVLVTAAVVVQEVSVVVLSESLSRRGHSGDHGDTDQEMYQKLINQN